MNKLLKKVLFDYYRDEIDASNDILKTLKKNLTEEDIEVKLTVKKYRNKMKRDLKDLGV